MSFEPYKDWSPDDDEQDIDVLRSHLEILLVKHNALVDIISAMNDRAARGEEIINHQGKQIEALTHSAIANANMLQVLWGLIKCGSNLTAIFGLQQNAGSGSPASQSG